MNKYLLDTEFIRASKERVHFLEVALLEVDGEQMIDFHLNARLNNWEQKYFDRGLWGRYGKRTKEVFEAVDVLYSNRFDFDYIGVLCNKLSIDYKSQKLRRVRQLEETLENSILYAWDCSNDIELFKQVKLDNYELIDVQNLWRAKFGGNQLSLINAYKTMLYNLESKDKFNLIDNAHYACCDVMMLKYVLKFINEYAGNLKIIPIHIDEKEKKLSDLEERREFLMNAHIDIENELNSTIDQDVARELSIKLIRNKRKQAKCSNQIKKLTMLDVYELPWWK